MRKYLLLFTFALAACLDANAQSVSKEDAASKAAAFLQSKNNTTLEALPSPYETMYFFGIKGGGFIIVSADNRVQPILGYSLQSHLETENLPSNFTRRLDDYDEQIRSVMENGNLPVHNGWREGHSPKTNPEGFDSIVGPMLTTTWNQDPLYNDLCPRYNGQLTMTGCIATAMAQVMKYWNWPVTGDGQHSYSTSSYGTLSADFGGTTYDWGSMPNSLTTSSSPEEVTAVATLMYHCGVAVEMEYGIVSSGISSNTMSSHGLNHPCPENALRTYFKYSPALRGVRHMDVTNDEWTALIKEEIDHRRPVLFSGIGNGEGHEFVCDGYDTNGYFHFNWGWGGLADGYFSLSNLNPSGSNFSNSQEAIIGIEPDTLYGGNSSCMVTVTSADTTQGTVNGGGVFNYRDTVILTAQPLSGYRFLRWSNGSSVNPYPLLAHDISMTANFTEALAEHGDILSYCGQDVSNTAPFSNNSRTRVGIKLPAGVISGQRYLSAVDYYSYQGKYVIYIHRGGDDAPGTVVYTQPFEIAHGVNRWYRAKLETPVPIDSSENLWITIRPLETMAILGISNRVISDGNWVSLDDGASWGHLNETEPLSSRDDISICWLIRCVTTADSSTNTNTQPVAFLIASEQVYTGDTLEMELLKSTASRATWDFGDADYSNLVNDTAYLVWNNAGQAVVSAAITNPYGSTNVSATIRVSECGTPVHTFPYVLNYDEEDEEKRNCWQIVDYGERSGYYLNYDYISVLLGSQVDDWYISPLFDLSGDSPLWLEIEHLTPTCGNMTVELSQGGMDTSDFSTIYTLEPTGTRTTTQPINLTEHYQGNPIRIAVRIRLQPGSSSNKFELTKLRIWDGNAGIADAVGMVLGVSPNPAHGIVTVTLPYEAGTLTLFDASGRQVMQFPTVSTQTTMDVNGLTQGIYLLRFSSPQGSTTTKLEIR